MRKIKRSYPKIIRLDHFYNIDHKTSGEFIETDIAIDDLIRIVAAMQLKLEDLADDGDTLEEKQYVKLLVKHFDAKDVTHIYKDLYDQMLLKADDWKIINAFEVETKTGVTEHVLQIDLYEARELHSGPGYKRLIENMLPSSREFEKDMLVEKTA